MAFFDGWLKNVQTACLGPRCALCHAPANLEQSLCAGCHADLPWLTRACSGCAEALPADSHTFLCGHCARRPRFDRAIAAFGYREPIRWLVAGLKFRGHLAHARLLGDLLAEHIAASDIVLPDLLVPVPLHVAALRRRGFNQAEQIAARLARRLDRPLGRRVVERMRDTAPQSALPAAGRSANVRDAFECPKRVDNRHLAIVDDVVTTTRTAAAVAARLRAAGARRVDVYCVARA